MRFTAIASSFLLILILSHPALASGASIPYQFEKGDKFNFKFEDHHYIYEVTKIENGLHSTKLTGCLDFYDHHGVISMGCEVELTWFQRGKPTELSGAGLLYFPCYRIDFYTSRDEPELYDCDGNKLKDGISWSLLE